MSPLAFVAIASTAVAVAALAYLGRLVLGREEERRRLQLHQAHLEELFESSDEPATLVDRVGRIIRANDAFLQLFGRTAHEVRGMPLDTILTNRIGKDGERSELNPVDSVEGKAPASFDAVGRKADGAAIEVSVMVGPVHLPGHPAVAFVMVRDDTRKFLVDAAFRRLEQALRTMQLGVTVTDLSGRIVYANPADAAMHGWKPEELVGKDVRVLAPPELAQRRTPEEIAGTRPWSRESVNVRKDGTAFPVHLTSDVVKDRDGTPIGLVTTCEDITQRKVAERAIRESEERYALAVRGANDGLWDWNLETGKVFFSGRWREMLGLGSGDHVGTLETWLDRVHPDDRPRLERALADHRQDRTQRFESEHRIRREDGSWCWVLARGIADRDPEGHPYRIVGALTDIDERKSAERQLAQDALYDPLTGLPNRAFLFDLLQRSVARMERRASYAFAVLFIDLDRFKQINDTLGHAAGDAALVQVARRLEECVRPEDVVTRLGGDEFCVLVDDIGDSRDATRVARRIHDALSIPLNLDGQEVPTGASIGIALSEQGGAEPHRLLQNADAAMYRAKRQGQAFEMFDRAMQEQAIAAMTLETELRRALDEGEFDLVYQPVVRLADRKVEGLEALVRWRHPERGVLAPGTFVPLAEETGFIVPLGWWILDEACRRMGEWSRRFPALNGMSVSVNVSSKQLRQPDLVDRVRRALERGSIPAHRLRLDVSEVVLMEDPDLHSDVVRKLRDLGVQVQVDDFGTGSSSLSHLDSFQVSTLKIDRSYVRKMDDLERDEAVVQAFITLARHLGIEVVAEGVETSGHEARLRDLHCEQGQGFLFHQPLSAQDVTDLLGRELDPAEA